ncbi:MAG TPA: Flp family type IVb pilin [Hyphomicrobiales bacterium]|nr:Flp family type IVb pilin [Hyphomicrobiales bacterium]
MRLYQALLHHCLRLAAAESGATAIEYALIAVIVSVAIVAGVTSIGGQLTNIFNGVGNNLQPH